MTSPKSDKFRLELSVYFFVPESTIIRYLVKDGAETYHFLNRSNHFDHGQSGWTDFIVFKTILTQNLHVGLTAWP